MRPLERPAATSSRSADEALIARLLAVISADAPRVDAEQLLAPDVISHMDQFTVRGIDVWYDWLDFLLSKAQGKVTARSPRTGGFASSIRPNERRNRTGRDIELTEIALPRSGQHAATMREFSAPKSAIR